MPSTDTRRRHCAAQSGPSQGRGPFSEQFEKAKDNARKQKLAQEICTELTVHATIEEEIFYPACKEAVEDDLEHEAYVEHDGAKVLIAEIAQGNPDGRILRRQGHGPFRNDQASREGRGEAGRRLLRPGAQGRRRHGSPRQARSRRARSSSRRPSSRAGCPRRKPAASRATS